jgi:hypothetical protein
MYASLPVPPVPIPYASEANSLYRYRHSDAFETACPNIHICGYLYSRTEYANMKSSEGVTDREFCWE